ncbi:MAG: cytochrome d ubiquinol oxidase subunit II [Bryobacterales bacterium]|nr:cytochrome d ubiquinol oxidase subunit II [Bryobacterales bacterium]
MARRRRERLTDMETFWFCIVAVALTAYVILDGFDLGAGFVSGFIARTPQERRTIIASIGPFWDGNEVWLLAGGGVLFMAFPRLYASSFAGFYLPLMVVLWLLMLRGIAIEFGGHLAAPLWRTFWDTVFAGASVLLIVFYGAALGNVVRGVPLDAAGEFFLPLWTDFGVSGERLGILDWYTVTVALLATAALSMHGALWVSLRTTGDLQLRSAAMARRLWWAVAAGTVAVTAATFAVQPLAARSAWDLWALPFRLAAVAGLALAFQPHREPRAFLGSCLYLAGMLTSAAASLYPHVLPARPDARLSLTIANTSSSAYAQQVAVYWWLPAFALCAGYFVFLYSRFATDKLSVALTPHPTETGGSAE